MARVPDPRLARSYHRLDVLPNGFVVDTCASSLIPAEIDMIKRDLLYMNKVISILR